MADPLEIALHASGAETTSSSGAPVDIGQLRSCVKATLVVSAISGTGAKLTAVLDTAPASTGPWLQVGAFATVSVARSLDAVFADCRRWVRLRWAFDGTLPSATFEAAGQGHVLYASLKDIETHGMPKGVISSVPAEERAQHALAATGEAEGYLSGGYTLPLSAWGDELRRQVAQIAVYAIMSRRGFQPQGTDELIVKNRDDAISWMGKIAKGLIKPPGIVDATPTVSGSRPRIGAGVNSNCSTRGW